MKGKPLPVDRHLGVVETAKTEEIMLVDLEAASLNLYEAVMSLGEKFHFHTTDHDTACVGTAGDAIAFIRSKVGSLQSLIRTDLVHINEYLGRTPSCGSQAVTP